MLLSGGLINWLNDGKFTRTAIYLNMNFHSSLMVTWMEFCNKIPDKQQVFDNCVGDQKTMSDL